jgi:hypothetical protein
MIEDVEDAHPRPHARQGLTARQPSRAKAFRVCVRTGPPMIDNFALALSHGLLILTAWRLLRRPDLDRESLPEDRKGPRGA